MIKNTLACTLLISCLAASAFAQVRVQLTVATAANAAEPVEELGRKYAQARLVAVTISTGATGLLSRQLREGAPFDAFVSADMQTVQKLASEGLITSSSVRPYATGELVLWVGERERSALKSIDSIAREAAGIRLALANPESAPYGAAGREVLKNLNIWDDLQARLVIAENVTNAFQLARTGNTDAAFVSLSIATKEKEGITSVPQELYTPIVQGLGVCSRSKFPAESASFCRFLLGPDAAEIWRRFGYEPQ